MHILFLGKGENKIYKLSNVSKLIAPVVNIKLYGDSLDALSMHNFTIKGHISSPMLNGRSEGHTFLTTAIVYTSGNED